MKKRYIYTRIGLLIALLTFQTFSACVHTQTFSPCFKTKKSFNIVTNSSARFDSVSVRSSNSSSPSIRPAPVLLVIGGIAFLVLVATTLYCFTNTLLASNMTDSNGNSFMSDWPHIGIRSVSNEDSGNSSAMFTGQLDGYEARLGSSFDNALPRPRSNGSLLTSMSMKTLFERNINSSNHSVIP